MNTIPGFTANAALYKSFGHYALPLPDYTVCGPFLKNCSGTCVDTQKDRNHCGRCGTVCNSGSFCCHGQCAVDGYVCCDDPALPYPPGHVCCPPGLHQAACPAGHPVCCGGACCREGDGCTGGDKGTCCNLGE